VQEKVLRNDLTTGVGEYSIFPKITVAMSQVKFPAVVVK
jgi:hypothetical protein